MIQETSKTAYMNLPMGDLQDKVLKILETYPTRTNQEIGAMIGKDASTVSGVMRPLVKIGKVVEGMKRICNVTGNNAIAWRLAKAPQQIYSPKKLEEITVEATKLFK